MKSFSLVLLGLVLGIAASGGFIYQSQKRALSACNAYCEGAPDPISNIICNSQCDQIINGSICLRFPPEAPQEE